MITVVWLFIAISTVIVHVAGSKLEASDGQNVTMLFETKLERVDEVKIIFEGENKGKVLFAYYCSRDTRPICDVKSENLQVEEGNVSLILLKVDSSRTGLYRAQAFFGKNVDELNATLVVNKPPFSSSSTPPHSSTPKSPNSSEHQGQLITAIIISCIIIIIIIIVVFVFRYFWKHRRVLSFQKKKKGLDTPPHSECVAVSMNACGENLEALLPDTPRCPKTLDNVTNMCSCF